MRDLESRCDL